MNNRKYNQQLVEQFFKEYHDRGMMKWQGFYLSDHTVALAKNEKEVFKKNNRQRAEPMSLTEISEVIELAIEKNKIVEIELKEVNQNLILPDVICGKIIGYQENKLIVNNKFIDIDNIHSVQYLRG